MDGRMHISKDTGKCGVWMVCLLSYFVSLLPQIFMEFFYSLVHVLL